MNVRIACSSADYADVAYGTSPSGAVRSALSDLSTANDYQLDIFIVPYNGAHHGKYTIFARMDNTTPVATTDGIVAELVMEDAIGTYSGSVKVYVAGVLNATHNFTGGAPGAPETGWLSVLISGNNVSCTWAGRTLLAATSVAAPAGARVGFGIECTQSGGVSLVDAFRNQPARSCVSWVIASAFVSCRTSPGDRHS